MRTNKFIISLIVLLVLALGTALFYIKVISKGNPGIIPVDSSLSDIKKKGTLVIASDIEFEPMEFYDPAGNPVGLDIDIAKEIAKSLAVTPEIRMVYWDKLFPTVINGEVDMGISSVTILPDRAKEMLFSNPYFDSGQVLLVRSADTSIRNPQDLNGKKIGVFPDTTGKAEISKFVNPDNMIDYITFEVPKDNPNSGILYDLKTGAIDAIVTDYIGAIGNVKNNPELKIAGEPFTQEYYGIITKRGNNALIQEINRILNQMKTSGKLKEISDRWLKG
jgi:ABC-type amino acid transport substrate-binding protein